MRLLWIISLALFFHIGYSQYDVPEVPDIQKGLYQYASLFSSQQQQALEKKLKMYADSTSTQIVIIVIESTNGEDISMLSTKWGQKWGLGQNKKDNGMIILISTKDRQVDISTGYGIEHLVTDSEAESIINKIIVPHFKKGRYYSGIDKALDKIFDILKGEFKSDKKADKNSKGEIISGIIFIIILILLVFRSGNGGGLGLLGLLLIGDSVRSYSSGRSSSFGDVGGGFDGGFGGGGFGGGGASGDW